MDVQGLWRIRKDSIHRNSRKKQWSIAYPQKKTTEEVARDLGISPHNLSRWRREYRKRGELSFPGHGKENLTPQEQKLRKLQKELTDIQIERDILKKALAIFTKKR